MKDRPLCCICLVIALFIGSLTVGAGAKFVKELRPSSIEKYGEEKERVIVRGQVYQKEEKEKYQALFLKNCSIYIQKNQKSQKSFIKESRLLICDESKNQIQLGNEIEAEGTLSFFEIARNPGNFDQKAYYQRQDIHGKVWSESCRIIDTKRWKIRDTLCDLRIYWKDVLREEKGDKNGSILSAILLGEKAQMDSEVKKLYQVNGIGHILAISGLHLSIIGIGIYRLLRKLTGSYTLGGIGGIIFFSLYVLMIGITVSVIRAGIMYLFRVGAEIAGRNYDSVTAFMMAASVVLIWRPLSIDDGAFWLFFLAVFAVLFVIPIHQSENIQEKNEDGEQSKFVYSEKNAGVEIWNNTRKKLTSMIKSNIEMQLFLLPIVIYYFYEIPLYAAFLNMLVVPLMSILLSLGLTGSIVVMTAPDSLKFLGTWLFTGCRWILMVYEKLCESMLEVPGARIVIGKPAIWQILIYYMGVAIVWILRNRGRKWRHLVMILIMVILIHKFEGIEQMKVTVLDVGQGDGIFIKGPGRMTCMIDGGSSDVKQVGQYRIEPYLLSKGVGSLDYVFISHGDSDHINGIEEMITRQKIGVKIKTLVFPEKKVWDESMENLALLAKKSGVKVAVIKEGQTLCDRGMEILCLGPGESYSGESGNAASMILTVSYRDYDFLFTGDAEGEGEEQICEALKKYCPEKKIEVLKAAHHGSRNSSSEIFLKQVRPLYTLISAGVDNAYGHPHAETVERLEKINSYIMSTANCGGIEITVEFGGKIQYTLKEGSEHTAYEESE